MPGFAISAGSSYLASPPKAAYYSYAWRINSLFETPIVRDSPLIYAQSITLPTWTVNTDTIQGSSLNYKYADNITWEDVRITFYDAISIGYSISDHLRQWRNRVWSSVRGIGSADTPNRGDPTFGYKRTSEIYNVSNDGTRYVKWTLYNSWPQSIKYGDLTYTNSEVKLVEVVVTYDHAEDIESYGIPPLID